MLISSSGLFILLDGLTQKILLVNTKTYQNKNILKCAYA
jgi:hypothetical protein